MQSAQRELTRMEYPLSLPLPPANVQALRGRVWAQLMNVIAGRNVCESFAILDPDGSWLKTYGGCCQLMLDGSMEKYSGAWPKWGMMLNGECTAPTTSELRSNGKDCNLWPTVTVNGNNNRKGISKKAGDGLATAVKNWPTILASEAKHGGPNQRDSRGSPGLTAAVNNWATPNTMDTLPPKSAEALRREAEITRKGRSAPANLRDQVNGLWPTPKASDSVTGMTARSSNRPIEKSTHLQTQVYLTERNMCPTPTARDYKGGRKAETLAATGRKSTNSLPDSIIADTHSWPTPKARDYKSGMVDRNRNSPDLNDVVLKEKPENWSTPNAADCKGSNGGGQGRSLRTDVHGSGGQLNPDWVETLMGYPAGWTDLEKATSFDLFRKREFWEVFGQLWPARRGEPQHEWEPTRVVTGMKGRPVRIRILGNAVVPQWAFIVLKVIAELERLSNCIKTPFSKRSVS